MKFITNIIKRFVKDDKKILGRWNIETCDVKRNKKIDWSNEDHCGPCGSVDQRHALHSEMHQNKGIKKLPWQYSELPPVIYVPPK